jgi:hypothetical protein
MCTGFTIDIGGKCVQGAVLVPSIVVPVVVLLALAAHIFERRRTKAARAQWTIHPEELLFDDPYTVCTSGVQAALSIHRVREHLEEFLPHRTMCVS